MTTPPDGGAPLNQKDEGAGAHLLRLFRRWLIAGLLIWIPLSVTLLLLRFLVSLLDNSLLLLPARIRPEMPLFGVGLSVVLVIGTGILSANYLGAQALRFAENLVGRIPLIRSVYGGMKKLAETLFSGSSVSFRQPVMIEYPRKGIWSIAFITGEPIGEIQDKTRDQVLTCFVPTTPNPTSGFIVLVPAKDVTWLKMSVEEAMRLIISLGVVVPDHVVEVDDDSPTPIVTPPVIVTESSTGEQRH